MLDVNLDRIVCWMLSMFILDGYRVGARCANKAIIIIDNDNLDLSLTRQEIKFE